MFYSARSNVRFGWKRTSCIASLTTPRPRGEDGLSPFAEVDMSFPITRRATLGMMGGAAIVQVSPAFAQKSARPSFERSAIAWLRRNAQPLASANPPPDALKPLVAALGGAQVVGLGEATHGTHEDFTFKAALVRALVVHGGLQVVALECNRRPGVLLDRYVNGRGGDPIEILRKSGIFQVLQAEEIIGLISWLRAWNAAGKTIVRIIGVDCQALGVDTMDAINWLEKHSRPAASALRRRLAPVVQDAKLREGRTLELLRTLSAAQWQAVMSALEDLGAAIGKPAAGDEEHVDAAHAALTAKQALLSSQELATFATEAQKKDPELYMRRDQFMADNLLAMARGARAAYWAHNSHVLQDETFWGHNSPLMQDDIRTTGPATTGGHLKRRLGPNYRMVVLDYDRGRIHSKPFLKTPVSSTRETPWQVFEKPSLPNGSGRVLAAAGPPQYWVNFDATADRPPAAWLAHSYDSNWAGGQLDLAWPPGKQRLKGANILVFFRDVTPSRLYPFVPQR